MMNFTEKMTIVEKFNVIADFLEEQGETEMVEFLKDRAEKSVRKSSSKAKGITDEQKALRDEIVEVLTNAGKPMSISEMQKASEIIGACSTSKVSGNITPMLQNGKNPNPEGIIVRSMDKKVAKFAIA